MPDDRYAQAYEEVFRPLAGLDALKEIEGLGPDGLDKLPFGAIRLDRNGTVVAFNAHEAKLTGRDPKRVIGRNFFTQVAPCTNVQRFAGEFRRGVERGELNAVFPFRFDFQMAPRDVTVSLIWSRTTQSAWVFVREGQDAIDAR